MIQGAVKPAIQGAIFGAIGANNYSKPFHPRQLFTGADLGFVHDPNVAASLFEVSNGTAPITSAGRPNGLILDSRFNLALGPELASGILSSTSNWAFVGAGTVAGNALVFNTPPNASAAAAYNPLLSNGRRYGVSFTVNGTGLLSVKLGSGGDGYNNLPAGSHGFYGLASGGTPSQIQFSSSVSAINNFVGTVANLSVQEILGNHAAQASPPSRPIFQTGPSSVVFDGVDDSHTTLFASSLGSACTVARAIPGTGAQILTGQTIGTSFTNTTTHASMVIINRALTSTETANLTIWLNKAAGL